MPEPRKIEPHTLAQYPSTVADAASGVAEVKDPVTIAIIPSGIRSTEPKIKGNSCEKVLLFICSPLGQAPFG